MKHTFGAGDKPLDFGYGGISGCLTHAGRFVAINQYHPEHGYVTLSSAPPFPDEARYDPARVRQYRREVVAQDGFGVALPHAVITSHAYFDEADSPVIEMTLANGATARCVTKISNHLFQVEQIWEFSEPTTFLITGHVWAMRCAYPQLTEGGVLPPVRHSSIVKKNKDFPDFMFIENESVDWSVKLRLENMPIENIDGSVTIDESEKSADEKHPFTFEVLPNFAIDIVMALSLAFIDNWKHRYYFDDGNENPLNCLNQPLTGEKDYPDDPLHTRAWRYARLCATPTESDTLCILTDHMILPLSWNRDSYYAARLFLDDPQSTILTEKHLLWLFETAERINGVWGRSYLANGKIKDRGFQLDQQLFPLLELAEYVQITGDTSLLDRLRHHIQPIFEALHAYRAPHALLYATEETPADDPIALPYPLSSHILLWRVLSELQKIGCGDLSDLSPNDVAYIILTHFIATPPNGDAPLFAYATDGAGKHHFYHDANDVPLVLMPAWKFCPANDPVWRATMDFAFSPANVGGFYDGSLGSVHTPAPWALGDIQEWIFARAIGDTSREQAVLSRLQHVAQWDGALSEAYEAGTGNVVSRHWFLWTNAFYACVKRGIFD